MGVLADVLSASFARHRDLSAVELPAQGSSLSYGDLCDAAQRWAVRYPDTDRVLVLHIEKSLAYYQFLAAAFTYGRSFCPIDVLNPVGRVDAIVRQLDRPIIITDQVDRVEALQALGHEVDLIDSSHLGPTSPDALAPDTHIAVGDDPRYFMSTSGTTGVPKLVEVRHDATVKFIGWSLPFYDVGPGDRWAQFSNIGFDLNLVDFLTAIGGGATLVGLTTLGETTKLNKFVDEQRITHWHSVPSVTRYLLRGGRPLTQLRVLSFCGEPLLREQCVALRTALPAARIINTYGPTEGPLFCTAHEVSELDLADETLTTMPIGTPIPGWELDLVDDDQGTRIVLRGVMLAEGYHGIDDPAFGDAIVNGKPGRSFDTGDYVRQHGRHLCFAHRRDSVVKVNGIRIDLGEVTDACLRSGFGDPVVLTSAGRLVVFYEAFDGIDAPLDDVALVEVSRRLQARLPLYAVPSAFEFIEALPRSATGKVDRSALAKQLSLPSDGSDD